MPRRCLRGPCGVAVHQEVDHVRDVLLGAGEPVLQRQEIGAHVLRGAGDEAQDLRQPAQHLHLLRAGGGRDAARPSPLASGLPRRRFRKAIAPVAGRGHVELAHAGQLGHLGGRHRADHRVAMVAARLQRRQDRQEVVFEEQHRRDHDVALGDVGLAALERGRVVAPFGGGVHAERAGPASIRASARFARSVALARWLSIVTSTTRMDGTALRLAQRLKCALAS